MKYQSGFALFDVMLAWFIFIVALSILSSVQLRALKRVRFSYLKIRSVIQAQNLVESHAANQGDDFQTLYERWHQENQALFDHEFDHYFTRGDKFCAQIKWGLPLIETRYCG